MTMKELRKTHTDEQLRELYYALVARGDLRGASLVDDVIKYYNHQVKVVNGRKVPIGVSGECFWMQSYDNSKYGDPWGIYTTVRIGIKDETGNIWWTSLNNVELVS